jgi:hypothetical protein
MDCYVVDTARFAVDDLDGETMLMDLVEGRLVLLESGSAKLWPWVASGVSITVLQNHVAEREGQGAADSFSEVVNRLVSLGALVLATGNPSSGQPVNAELPQVLGEFLISEYDDISNIISMDPIHEVDPARGWPFEPTS